MLLINSHYYLTTQFYHEIGDSIETLRDGIFKPESEELQVKWPWPLQKNRQVGQLHIVTMFPQP